MCSDWNPHADLQAMARAHRLGQTSKVFYLIVLYVELKFLFFNIFHGDSYLYPFHLFFFSGHDIQAC
jgi:hypothetical protein